MRLFKIFIAVALVSMAVASYFVFNTPHPPDVIIDKTNLCNIETALHHYKSDNGVHPYTLTDLVESANSERKSKPYLMRIPKDAYEQDYMYARIEFDKTKASTFLLYSKGLNQIDKYGEGDDVSCSDK